MVLKERARQHEAWASAANGTNATALALRCCWHGTNTTYANLSNTSEPMPLPGPSGPPADPGPPPEVQCVCTEGWDEPDGR